MDVRQRLRSRRRLFDVRHGHTKTQRERYIAEERGEGEKGGTEGS